MIKAIIAACLLCVSSVSFVDASEAEEYALFRNVQCQFYAALSGYDDAALALWERNDAVINGLDYTPSSYDIAILVNQQYDHAISNVISYSTIFGVSELEASQYMYAKYCSNI